MRLTIVNLTSGGFSGGYKKYLQILLPLIQKNPSLEGELNVFVPSQAKNSFKIDSIPIFSWPANDHKKNYIWLKTEVNKLSPDIIFIPTARYIKFNKIPTVTMIRNMEPLCTPFGGNPLLESIKNIGRAFSAYRSCKRADRVIAVSKHVKTFLETRWSISKDRIGVVYHGVDLPDCVNSLQPPAHFNNLAKNEFIFTAGSIRPARGLEDLLAAFSLTIANNPNIKLLIAGNVDPGMQAYKRKLSNWIVKLGIDSRIVWAGPLQADEMSWCYSNCSVFVMTSRAEACPNIVLEAMAHGCVCVSTETPPMPEFFTDNALYYPQGNSKILANAIQTAVKLDNGKRIILHEKARKYASQYSWKACAENTVLEMQRTLEQYNRLKGRCK